MYLNKVELMGSLGSDGETKTTANGKSVTTFSLATKTSYKKDGERQERTEWHRVQIWGRLGEYAAAFQEGRACLRRRRAPPPRVRKQRR